MADFNELLRTTEAENEARRAANLRAKESAVVTPTDLLWAADLLDQVAGALRKAAGILNGKSMADVVDAALHGSYPNPPLGENR